MTRDQYTNKCISKENFEKYLRGELGSSGFGVPYNDGQSGEQKKGSGLLWLFLRFELCLF